MPKLDKYPEKFVGLDRSPTIFSDGKIEVDEKAGTIKNVALMTEGPAIGHPFDIDATTVDQLIGFAKDAEGGGGVKSRFRHPQIKEKIDEKGNVVEQQVGDDTGTQVGRIKNVRRDGICARGDVYLGEYAKHIPGQGDLWTYLCAFARTDPSSIGMSAFFPFEVVPKMNDMGEVVAVVARLHGLEAIDFVGKSAANPRGLLSAKTIIKAPEMDLKKEFLSEIVRAGSINIAGLALRHSHKAEAMRATLTAIVNSGHARIIDGKYYPTPRGVAAMALIGICRSFSKPK